MTRIADTVYDPAELRRVRGELDRGEIPSDATIVQRKDGAWVQWSIGKGIVRRHRIGGGTGELRTGPVIGGTSLVGGSPSRTISDASPVKQVVVSRSVRDSVFDHGFDGQEVVYGLWGEFDRDGTLWLEHARNVSDERYVGSVTIDPAKLRMYDEAIADTTGHPLVGDLHTHPRNFGAIANPSTYDLKAWRRAAKTTGWHVGVIVQRHHESDGDSGWLSPSWTAIIVTNRNGHSDCSVLVPEIERSDRWQA